MSNDPKTKEPKQMDFGALLFGEGQVSAAPQVNAQVEIFAAVTKEMYSTKNLMLKTELNDRQVMVFAQAFAFAKRYKIPLLKEVLINYSKNAISKNRKGRKEYGEVAKAHLQIAGQEEREPQSIPDRILGRR